MGSASRLACLARRLAEPISSASRRRTTPGTGRRDSLSAPTRSRDVLPETQSAKFHSPEIPIRYDCLQCAPLSIRCLVSIWQVRMFSFPKSGVSPGNGRTSLPDTAWKESSLSILRMRRKVSQRTRSPSSRRTANSSINSLKFTIFRAHSSRVARPFAMAPALPSGPRNCSRGSFRWPAVIRRRAVCNGTESVKETEPAITSHDTVQARPILKE